MKTYEDAKTFYSNNPRESMYINILIYVNRF